MKRKVFEPQLRGKLSLKRRTYAIVLKSLIYIASGITILLLLGIIGYIFYRGLPNVTWRRR